MAQLSHPRIMSLSQKFKFFYVLKTIVVLFYLFIFLINLFMAALGLHCCADFLQLQRAGATLRCGVRASHCGGFSCCRARALGTRASVVVAHGLQQLWLAGLQSTDSVVVVHGLGCSMACGIFPDQGSNPCPLHWQVDS